MKVLYIGPEKKSILTPNIVMEMLFLMVKVLKYLQVMEELDIRILRLSTIPFSILEFIIVAKMLNVDIGLKISANLPLLNCGVYYIDDKSGDNGRGVYRSQDNNHSSS